MSRCTHSLFGLKVANEVGICDLINHCIKIFLYLVVWMPLTLVPTGMFLHTACNELRDYKLIVTNIIYTRA